MATLELKLTVPDGTKVTIFGAEGATIVPDDAAREDNIERYWRDYLSDNARKVFGAAARIETFRGPGYTLEDIAQNLSITYESVGHAPHERPNGKEVARRYGYRGTHSPCRRTL